MLICKQKIKNMKVQIEDRIATFMGHDVHLVDLIIDEQKFDTGKFPPLSYDFWKDLNQASEKAMYRIKSKNKGGFNNFENDFSDLTKEEKKERFYDFLKKKYNVLDVENIVGIINEKVAKTQLTGPDDNHPNPYMKTPLESDFLKDFILSVIIELESRRK